MTCFNIETFISVLNFMHKCVGGITQEHLSAPNTNRWAENFNLEL